MQRIRVGLTGLAVIILIVFLATALITQLNSQAGGNQTSEAKDGNEPLSHLGVVPPAPDNSSKALAPQKPSKPAVGNTL